tara:strand:+ start:2035 stop:2466 length:432 start_codon:yes stop_codon:yes gene_type:complete
MLKKLNFQYLFSYFGLIPYFYILINKYFFFEIKEEIFINFLIYYTLFILVFIGSLNWNLEKKLKFHIVFYGFLPSIFAVIITTLNLYNFNVLKIFISLIFFLIFQLFLDYFLIYSKKTIKSSYYLLRLPLTIAIIIILVLIIF